VSWKSFSRDRRYAYSWESPSPPSFGPNAWCFIRKNHPCGKLYGASKSCFIASPSEPELDPLLELISEKLTKQGVEPVIAVRERAYGQDIFCTKICGRIIESRFCLVILDDNIVGTTSVPNPNVYYEYGLMTAMNKHIIPLQKENLTLAFNIQSYDTVKYTPANMASELNRAIKDAMRLAEGKPAVGDQNQWSDRRVMRCLELAGFTPKDSQWFLDDVIADTGFVGFDSGVHQKGYAFVAKVDKASQLSSILEDIPVLAYRASRARLDLEGRREAVKRGLSEHRKGSYLAERTETELTDVTDKLQRMSRMHIGIVVAYKCDTGPVTGQAQQMLRGYDDFEVAVSSGTEIKIGEDKVSFDYPTAGPASPQSDLETP